MVRGLSQWHTRDEGRTTSAFAFPEPPFFTEGRYQEVLVDAFDAQAPRVAAKYPSSVYGSPGLAWGAVLSDRVWACSHLVDDRYLARRTPTYGYEFADRNAPTGYLPFPADIPGGAFHSSELAYLFDVAGFEAKFTPEQQRLAGQMIAYWTRFAATGNPNGRDLPAWQPFRYRDVQSLAPDGIRPVDLEEEHNCKFWL